MTRPLAAVALAALVSCAAPPDPRFPRAMVVPYPDSEWSFQVDGREWLRYVTGPNHPKPYFFPVVGPCGRPVTRITHPRDPFTHAHHLSLWIGHSDVAGSNFWEHMRSPARIVHDHVERIDDGDAASLVIHARWLDGEKKVLMLDKRVWTLRPLYETMGGAGHGEFHLDLDLTLSPPGVSVTLGKTNFGLLAVRVAKTMTVQDGGGLITNSEGKVGEKDILWQKARWCDYSGPAAPGGVVNGIALFDHPKNPRHPANFHVRSDGWMGAQTTRDDPLEITKEKPLVLRYRFWVHAGGCDPAKTESQWRRWAE